MTGVIKNQYIKISAQHQLTIPQAIYKALGFSNEAEMIVKDGEVVIRPVSRTGNDFASDILKELIAEGYSTENILEEFNKRQKQTVTAINNMMQEVKKAATGEIKTYSIEEVFDD